MKEVGPQFNATVPVLSMLRYASCSYAIIHEKNTLNLYDSSGGKRPAPITEHTSLMPVIAAVPGTEERTGTVRARTVTGLSSQKVLSWGEAN